MVGGGHIVCGNDNSGVLAGTRICMVVYSHYPRDQRVRREAVALSERGAIVHVICLKDENEKRFEIHNNISIYRIPIKLRRSGGYVAYFFRYFMFLFLSTALLKGLYFKYRYKAIHIHSLPDFEVFCAFVPKLFGAKVILDLHELMPEVFATKFNLSMDSRSVRTAEKIEKISVDYSDFTITTSPNREKKLKARTSKSNITVIMNLPKKDIFKSRDMSNFIRENNLEKSFIVSFIGGLNPERELDIVIRSINHIKKKIPNIIFLFCGTGDTEYIDSLKKLIFELGLKENVMFLGFVPQFDVLNYVAISNVSLSPYKFHPNQDPVSSTKVFEYLLVPKPVIVSDYPANRREFKDMVLFYKSSDFKSLCGKILEVYENEEKYKKMAQNAQETLFKRYDPQKNEEKLIDIYKDLLRL
jgi:glycosyltransferase involved in cell wall biosynthesis